MEVIFFFGKIIIWLLAIIALVVFDFLTSPFNDEDIENFF